MPQEKDTKTKRKWLVGGAALVILIIIAFIVFGNGRGDGEFITVARQDIGQVVRITGRVSPSNDAALAFEKAGKVSYIRADVGERVNAGDLLVSIEASDIAAEVAQYRATVKAEEAKMAQLKRGNTPEGLAVYEIKLTNALVTIENSKKTAIDTVASTFTDADDAVHNKIDPMFSNPRTLSPTLNLAIEGQLKSSLENSRVTMETLLQNWPDTTKLVTPYTPNATSTPSPSSPLEVVVDGTIDDGAAYLAHLARTKDSLTVVRTFVDGMARAINLAIPSSQISQTSIDSYKAAILSARNNVNTAITTVTSAEESLRNAIAAAALVRSELVLARTPARIEEIDAQQARIDQADANVKNAEARLAKTRLIAPIDGIITEKDIEVGEIVTANKTVIKVIATDAFKIEANVPESEIANVKAGNVARITLDAYPDTVIEGAVALIDPAEILVDGVPTYKVTIRLNPTTIVVRSGMTANIRITTLEKKGVLVIPNRALIVEGDVVYATKITDGASNQVKVITGLRDDEGMIEIVEGLMEGDTVVIPVK